jgi:hypothetical protein
MADLDERIDAILAREAEREAARKKKEAASDPHILQKLIAGVFAKAERQRRLDDVREHVTVKVIEC